MRVIGSMEPEICTKKLAKLRAKFPATPRGYFIVKMLSQNLLNWKQAQWKVNYLSKPIRKGEKGKATKK